MFFKKRLSIFEFFFFCQKQVHVEVVFTGGFVHPEVQGVDGQGDLIQLGADEGEVLNFVVGDLAVPCDLD
mgnify:CR=1 FL=1